MTNTWPEGTTALLRHAVYGLLIVLATGVMIGRVLAVNSVDKEALEADRIKRELDKTKGDLEGQGVQGDELTRRLDERRREITEKLWLQRPFLSANDRSRWATVRALVEYRTYAIDDVVSQPNWDTIDMVKHSRSGEPHLYSSKPPLLATLIAGPYWLVHRLTGATLTTHPYEIGRSFVLVMNVVPLVLMFWVLSRLVDRCGVTDWGRIFVMGAATFATYLTTFVVVLNNHLPAAVSVAIAVDAVYRIWYEGEQRLRFFVLAGLFASFAAANELPALAFLALVSLAVLWKAPRQTLVAYLPAALLVMGAYFGTNYIAHKSLRPPYMHRSATDPEDDWYRYTFRRGERELHSYWENPSGIDKGEPSQKSYVLHALVGHHGIFSLTPIWILSVIGMGVWLTPGPRRPFPAPPRLSGGEKGDTLRVAEEPAHPRAMAAAIGLLSLVCIAFYLVRPEFDRNYGGMTSGFRWVFWFTPLWLLTMLPAVDWMSATRPRRTLALLLLLFSVIAVSFPTWNPWTHPWLTKLLLYLEWIKF